MIKGQCIFFPFMDSGFPIVFMARSECAFIQNTGFLDHNVFQPCIILQTFK